MGFSRRFGVCLVGLESELCAGEREENLHRNSKKWGEKISQNISGECPPQHTGVSYY